MSVKLKPWVCLNLPKIGAFKKNYSHWFANKSLLFLFFFCVLFSSRAQQAEIIDSSAYWRGHLSTFRQNADIVFYSLQIQPSFKDSSISGSTLIVLKRKDTTLPVQLDLSGRMFIFAIFDGNKNAVSYDRKFNSVLVHLKPSRYALDTLIVVFNGKPQLAKNPPWDGGLVIRKDALNRNWWSYTCEGLGASSWWPCEDHPADEPDSMYISLYAPDSMMAIANGELILKQKEEYNTLFRWRVSYPINLYNVTFYIGYYKKIEKKTVSQNYTVPASYYFLDYQSNEKIDKHLNQVKWIVTGFEQLFGPYPYVRDGYKIVESPYWGMEHQSAIAYGNQFQNNMAGVLDFILVHETAHEWWGNHITASDHGDLWVHEAFATYSEYLLLEKQYPAVAQSYFANQRALIKNKFPVEGPKNVHFNDWPDTDMYYKGAWLLHTFRNALQNDSLFFACLLAIQKKYAHQCATGDDIIRFMASFTQQPVFSFFKTYLKEKNIPRLKYRIYKKTKQYVMEYEWENIPSQSPISGFIGFSVGNKKYRLDWANPHPKTLLLDAPIDLKKILENTYYLEILSLP